jgi:hypothetical protein
MYVFKQMYIDDHRCIEVNPFPIVETLKSASSCIALRPSFKNWSDMVKQFVPLMATKVILQLSLGQ